MGLIARFLPNLIPGLGALANPWVLLALLSALVGAFMFGVHLEAGRFEAFKQTVAAVGKAQEVQSAQRTKDRKAITTGVDNVHQLETSKLRATVLALDRKLRTDPGGSVLPPRQQPVPTSGPDLACFDRAELDAALRRFAADTAGLVGEGSAAVLDLNTAKNWAGQQLKLSTDLKGK